MRVVSYKLSRDRLFERFIGTCDMERGKTIRLLPDWMPKVEVLAERIQNSVFNVSTFNPTTLQMTTKCRILQHPPH
jgi:hypothetical protein